MREAEQNIIAREPIKEKVMYYFWIIADREVQGQAIMQINNHKTNVYITDLVFLEEVNNSVLTCVHCDGIAQDTSKS